MSAAAAPAPPGISVCSAPTCQPIAACTIGADVGSWKEVERSASFAEVNNASRTRVLHTRYWPYSVGRFTKATTCMQGLAPCERKSSVVRILRPWSCSHDHEVFTAGPFMLEQLGYTHLQ
eukprot:scaffold15153_cov34-Phaeocystis_antarctica.AAC.1